MSLRGQHWHYAMKYNGPVEFEDFIEHDHDDEKQVERGTLADIDYEALTEYFWDAFLYVDSPNDLDMAEVGRDGFLAALVNRNQP